MKKGQEYIGKVQRYEFPCKGIIEYAEGGSLTKVAVKGALPGQTVRFILSKKRNNKCEGRLTEVIERSPLENAVPFCKCYAQCGGCTYQELSYDNQLKLKEAVVKDIMDRAINGSYVFEGIQASPVEWAYRNKMEFSFGDEYKEGPLALGLHRRGSFYDIVTTADCRIVNDDFNIILTAVLDFFRKLNIPFYHKLTHKGYLRHLVIRRAARTGELLVNIVTSGNLENFVSFKAYDKNNESNNSESNKYDECDSLSEERIYRELGNCMLDLKLQGTVTGILHTVNNSLADVVQSDRMDIIYGRDYIIEKVMGLYFKISPFSFFQTNTAGAELLYKKAREFMGYTKDMTVFDLYSGTGTIAQIIAPVAKKVIGVEIVKEAVEAARENAKINGLNNCEFITGDVLKVIDNIEEKPDVIILDPPRDGIHPKALEKIAEHINAPNIIYISCKPTSLARDIVKLQEYGYVAKRVCCVDMFPHTAHVETVCLLTHIK